MDQVQSSTASASIQDVNAALLAQYRAAQTASSAQKTTGQASFASTLQKVEQQPLAPPTALKATTTVSAATTATTSTTTPVSSTAEADAADDSAEECAAPKISRSARMACAEKATEVAYEDDDFSIGDFVDLLNPLQHIPVIGSIYRELTGDTIKPDVQVAGSLLFGAATGSILLSAATGIASATMESQTGKEPTIQVAESVFGDNFLGTPDTLTEPKIVLADAGGTVEGKVSPSAVAQEKTAETQGATTTSSAATATTSDAAAPAKTAMPGLLASTGGMRIGNKIYTSPMMRSAGKAAPAKVATTSQSVTQSTEVQQSQATETTLAALIQEQAVARDSGQTLPPERIQDIMVKALDKYKMAHATTSAESAVTAVP